MNLNKKIITMCFVFSTTLTITGCGDDSSSGSAKNPTILKNEIKNENPPKEVGSLDWNGHWMSFFKDDIRKNAHFLDNTELGSKRVVTTKGYTVVDGVKCNFTFTIKEELKGTDIEGLPEVLRETNFKNESENPICQEEDEEFNIEFPFYNVRDLLEEKDILSEGKDNVFERIGVLKYRAKGFEVESGNNYEIVKEVETIFDLKRPLFFNPIETNIIMKINNNEILNFKTVMEVL